MRKELFDIIRKEAFFIKKVILSSGKTSNYYVDIRRVSLQSRGAYLIANLLWKEISKEGIFSIGGPTLGADPILSALAYHAYLENKHIKTFIIRKERKKHGQAKFIEGPPLKKGAKAIIIDDVATTGKSLVDAVVKLRTSKVKVKKAFVVVDREEGAAENLAKVNLSLFSLFKLSDFI